MFRRLAAAASMRLALGLGGGAALGAALLLSGHEAAAKASYDSAYGYDRTWNAAFRMVRVDLGFKVLEKDQGTGYLLFEYKSPESGQKPSSGSIELIRGRDDGPVTVVVQLPQMPHHHEQVLINGLARKLRQEYGDPPARPTRSERKPEDAGAPDAEP